MTAEYRPQGVRMSRAEVAGLLALVASYGPADVGEAAVSAWGAALAGYSLGECTAAVIAHAQTSPHRITPADLVNRIRTARRGKADRAVVPAITTAPRRDDARHRGMAAVYAAMRWKRTDRDAGLTVPCPVESCRAPVGTRCRRTGRASRDRPESRDLLTGSHPSRAELAARTAADTTTAVTDQENQG